MTLITYRYDLKNMIQTNTSTKFQRKIRRVPINSFLDVSQSENTGRKKDSPHTDPQNADKVGEQLCTICYSNVLNYADQLKSMTSNCRSQHPLREFCNACVRMHVKTQVDEGRTKISCPKCSAVLHDGDVQRWADPGVFQSYSARASDRSIQMHSEFRWCAHTGCKSGQLHEGGDDHPIMTCAECGGRTCITHRCVWHTGLTCHEYDEQTAETDHIARLVSTGDLVRCPKCSTGVEKADGCDHMTCRREAGGCGHEFCWLCLAPYDGPTGIRQVGNRAHNQDCKHHR